MVVMGEIFVDFVCEFVTLEVQKSYSMNKFITSIVYATLICCVKGQMSQGLHNYSNDVIGLSFMLSEGGSEILWVEVADKKKDSIDRGKGEWRHSNFRTVDPDYDGPLGWYEFSAGGYYYEFEEPSGKNLKLTRSRNGKSEEFNLKKGQVTITTKDSVLKSDEKATGDDMEKCKKIVGMEYSSNADYDKLLEKYYTRKMIRLICKGRETDEFGLSNYDADYRTDLQDGRPDSVQIGDVFQEGKFVVVRVDLSFDKKKYQKLWKFQKEDGRWLICDILTKGHEIKEQNGSLAEFLSNL